jgi:hypothetical protein
LAKTDPNPVYQWAATVSGTNLSINVLKVETNSPYEGTAVSSDGVIRAVMESVIERNIDVLVAKSTKEQQNVTEGILKAHDDTKSAEFSSQFKPYTEIGPERGMLLLEPYVAPTSDLVMAGSAFTEHGNRNAKRLRLSGTRPDGKTVDYKLRSEYASRPQIDRFNAPPITELRMLAGEIEEIHEGLDELVLKLLNVMPPIITSGVNPGINRVNTLLSAGEVNTIIFKILGDTPTSRVLLPLWKDAVITEVNAVIEKNLLYMKSDASTKAIMDTMEIMLDAVVHPPQGGGGPFDVDDQDEAKDAINEIIAEINTLQDDPILFISGLQVLKLQRALITPKNRDAITAANLAAAQNNATAYQMPYSSPFVFVFPEPQMILLAGIDEDDLIPTPGIPQTDRKFVSCAYLSDEVVTSTLYNILVNPKTKAIRLSEWTNAISALTTAQTIKATPVPPTLEQLSMVKAPWLSQISVPNTKMKLHLHLAGSKADKADGDFDEMYKKYEVELRRGDQQMYVTETMTVVKLMLEMLIGKVDTITSEHEIAPELAIYNTHSKVGLDRKFIPVFEHVEGATVTTRSIDDHSFPKILDGNVSACSSFLYANAVLSSMSGVAPDKDRNIAAFMAATTPIRISAKDDIEFINTTLDLIIPEIITAFETALTLEAVRDQGLHDISNQAMPAVHFSFTQAKSNKFKLTIGSEITSVLAGIISAIHLVNTLSNEMETADIDPPTEVFGEPFYGFDPRGSDIDTKRSATSHASNGNKHVFVVKDKVINTAGYAKFLHLDNKAGNSAGDLKFGSTGPGITGAFNVTARAHRSVYWDLTKTHPTNPYSPAQWVNYALRTQLVNPIQKNIVAGGRAMEHKLYLYTPDTVTYSSELIRYLHTHNPKTMKSVSFPIWEKITGAVIGYITMSNVKFEYYNDNTVFSITNTDWDVNSIFIMDSDSIEHNHTKDTENDRWHFRDDVEFGIIYTTLDKSALFEIKPFVPLLYTTLENTRVMTRAAEYISDPTPEPFKYYKTKKPIEISQSDLASTIVSAIDGIHHSNLNAIHYTVFAEAIGELKKSGLAKLDAFDTRWPGEKMPWALDSGSGTPMANMLKTLHLEHEKNMAKTTILPLVESVWVYVRGPGDAACSTICTVSGIERYLTKTNHFKTIETDLIVNMMKMYNEAFVIPSSAVPNCLAEMIKKGHRFTGVHHIMEKLPGSESIVTRLMSTTLKLDQVTRRPTSAMDTKAIHALTQQWTQTTQHLLYSTKPTRRA